MHKYKPYAGFWIISAAKEEIRKQELPLFGGKKWGNNCLLGLQCRKIPKKQKQNNEALKVVLNPTSKH